MRHVALADAALSALALRVWRARGGYFAPLRVISVARGSDVSLRVLEVGDTLRCIGAWTITNYEDVPDAIRLIERTDRTYAGLVFHDRVGEDGCFWELVHPTTLQASRMFSRDWRAPYGAI